MGKCYFWAIYCPKPERFSYLLTQILEGREAKKIVAFPPTRRTGFVQFWNLVGNPYKLQRKSVDLTQDTKVVSGPKF